MVTKDYLVERYCEHGKTQRQIANELGISYALVGIWMKKYKIPTRRGGRQRPDLKGKKFGKLLVLEKKDGCDEKHPAWECICDCGTTCTAYTSELCKYKKENCSKCGHGRGGKLLWRGHGEISGKFWSQIKWSAKTRNLPFEISIEESWELYLKQEKKCALTGEEIIIGKVTTASLDRIDSSKGYVCGNIQWIHKKLNWMKGNMSESEFCQWCKKVVEHHCKPY